jgi:hypothetical protein
MPDRELSTRDLAGQTATDEDARLATAQGSELESAQGDEPLMRERAAGGSGTRDANDAPGSTVEPITPAAEREPLLSPDQGESFTTRWREIQASFVDEPREAVAEADALVADLMQKLAASFSNERERLEAQWDRGDDVSTEDLRVALTRYRSFFDRLLAA